VGSLNWREEKILITGGTGLIGFNLTQRLDSLGIEVLSVGNTRGNYKCDLRDQRSTKSLFDYYQPKVVFHLAAKVGGIYANVSKKSDFYLDNTQINTNVIGEIQKREIPFVFAMGTGCAYPKYLESRKLYEKNFLNGPPEVTNDAYAYSKRNLLVHLKACRENHPIDYVYCIPANIYGPFDNFHPAYSHVVPGLIVKFLSAIKNNDPKVTVGGSGVAKRDFLYIGDLIEAIILICDKFVKSDSINVATGTLTTISDLADLIRQISGYKGEIDYDLDYPEGQKKRMFDISKVKSMDWKPKETLNEGIRNTINWCFNNPQLVK
jgi:GDP-L-fucose synthase